MTTLKIAVEANERDGRLRDDDPHAIVHAYDAEKGDFAFHSVEDTPYVVKTDIKWTSVLPQGQRRPECRDRAAENTAGA